MAKKPEPRKRPTITIDLGRRWHNIAKMIAGKRGGRSPWTRGWTSADVVRAGLELLALHYLSELERKQCGYPDKRIWIPEKPAE